MLHTGLEVTELYQHIITEVNNSSRSKWKMSMSITLTLMTWSRRSGTPGSKRRGYMQSWSCLLYKLRMTEIQLVDAICMSCWLCVTASLSVHRYRLVRAFFNQKIYWRGFDPFSAQKEEMFRNSGSAIYRMFYRALVFSKVADEIYYSCQKSRTPCTNWRARSPNLREIQIN